jgi:outer membrane protein assembly factor BamB
VLAIALSGLSGFSARAAATAYQADPAHSGFVSDPALVGALSERWSRRLGDEVSYPLIVGERVYVSVQRSGLPTLLYALDRRTGETLWTRSVHGAPAYDAGRIFTVGIMPEIHWTDDTPPIVLATDAATGAQRWRQELPADQWQFNVPPIARDGRVYVGGVGVGGTSYTLGATDGALLWRGWPQGYAGAALSPSSLLVADGGCGEAESLDLLTGARRWHYYAGCSGGGGSTPVFHDGRLYLKDFTGGHVVSATTGSALRYYTAGPPPALSATTGVFIQPDGSMEGRRLPGLERLWSFRPSQPLVSAPLIVDGVAYATSVDGQLYGVDLGSGEQVARHALGAEQIPNELLEPHLDNGLAAGGGLLVAPAGGRLVAFAPQRMPTVTGGPAGWSRAGSEGFDVSSSGPAECRIDIDGDRGTWEPCGGSLRVPQPREGDYRLFARLAPAGAATVRHWTVDRTPPTLSMLRDPGALGDLTVLFMFRADEPVRYECELDGHRDGGRSECRGRADWDLPHEEEGDHHFAVTGVDRAGNRSTPLERTWTIRSTSIPTGIGIVTEPSDEDLHNGYAPFTFDAAEPTQARFTCTLEGPAGTSSKPCESPVSYEHLGDGTHRFTVVANWSDGRHGAAVREFHVERRAPTATIVSGPTGVVTNRRASFGLSSDEAPGPGLASDEFPSYMCRLVPEDAEWRPCLQHPAWEDLADGRHTLQARALDDQWNRSAIVERTWTVDATPPTVTIGPGPEDTALAFTTDDPAARAFCRLDHGSWAACASPVAVPAAGTLEVRAVDASGNTGAPDRRTWSEHAAVTLAAAPARSGPAALGLHLRAVDRRLGSVLRRGLRLRISSSRACTAQLSLMRAGRRATRRATRRLTSRVRTLRVRLSRSARQRLASRRRAVLTVSISARAPDGARARLTRRVVLTRARR